MGTTARTLMRIDERDQYDAYVAMGEIDISTLGHTLDNHTPPYDPDDHTGD